MKRINIKSMTLAAALCALIVVMTVVPFTGYISANVIEITTLHIVVILGSVLLGWKYGAVLGLVWGITCLVRAFTNPLWILFTNPLISVIPRIFVGITPALIMMLFAKIKLNDIVGAVAAAVVGTLTNTVLVLGAISLFGGGNTSFMDYFKQIFGALMAVNGIIELVAAAIIVPVIYKAVSSYNRRSNKQ